MVLGKRSLLPISFEMRLECKYTDVNNGKEALWLIQNKIYLLAIATQIRISNKRDCTLHALPWDLLLLLGWTGGI
jgi:hypothetical protein